MNAMTQALTALCQSDRSPSSSLGSSQRDVHLPRARTGSVVDGRYALVREIARGAGGVVFEGEHVHTRARVAVKTMNYTRQAYLGRARLMREARALGAVRHPNIVPVLDAGDCRQCGPFVVLALIEGRTLESFVTARPRLDARIAVALAQQLGNALSVLARSRVVHRDVKPSNVLVVPGPYGEPDTAVLIDFGVAKIMSDSDACLTRHGDLVGTPAYMAPEQISGTDPIDHRTDVYGLGALVYECLTGTTPFSGHPLAVAASILAGAPPLPISCRRPDVSPALEAAVSRALAHRPDTRWPDATSFVRACVAATGGEPPALHLFPRDITIADTERSDGPQRKGVRSPYQAPARILTADGEGHDARIEDISTGGLLMVTRVAVATGAVLRVKFPLPMSGKVVTLGGAVKWVRAGQSTRAVGFELAKLPDDVRTEIELYSIPVY